MRVEPCDLTLNVTSCGAPLCLDGPYFNVTATINRFGLRLAEDTRIPGPVQHARVSVIC